MHLYAYCANNPINYVDPSGHNPIAIYYLGGVLLSLLMTVLITKLVSEIQKIISVSYSTISKVIRKGMTAYRNGMSILTAAINISVSRSFIKPPKNKTEIHHIVARTAKNRYARISRKFLEYVNIDVNSPLNLVGLKYRFHRRLHRTDYHRGVTIVLGGSLKVAKYIATDHKVNKTKRKKIEKRCVKVALSSLKSVLRTANIVAN